MKEATVFKATQFIKFGIVGFTNNVIFYIMNVIVLFFFKPVHFAWDYIIANIAGFFVSVLWSFYWNNKYVFVRQEGENRSLGKTLLKTYIAYGFTGIVLNNVLSYVWIDVLGMSKYIAPLINLFLTVPVNFILNKLWAFKNLQRKDIANDSSAV